MEKLTLEEQMEISAVLGVPMVDIQDRAERFMSEVYDLTVKLSVGPREGVLLLAMAYVFVVSQATNGNPVAEAKTTIDTAMTLLFMVNE